MSQDIFPIQIQVPVFVMARLCANAEIGVPRGRIACLRDHPCLSPSSLPLSVIPASLRHPCLSPSSLPLPVIPASPRHPCLSPSFLLLPPSFLRRQES
jgi:hypothetical protein